MVLHCVRWSRVRLLSRTKTFFFCIFPIYFFIVTVKKNIRIIYYTVVIIDETGHFNLTGLEGTTQEVGLKGNAPQ